MGRLMSKKRNKKQSDIHQDNAEILREDSFENAGLEEVEEEYEAVDMGTQDDFSGKEVLDGDEKEEPLETEKLESTPADGTDPEDMGSDSAEESSFIGLGGRYRKRKEKKTQREKEREEKPGKEAVDHCGKHRRRTLSDVFGDIGFLYRSFLHKYNNKRKRFFRQNCCRRRILLKRAG